MDSGDILAQEVIEVPDGISYAELESQCAIRGGTLLAPAVWDLYEGRAARAKQDETRSSYHTFPSDEDFVVRVEEWDARRVYNFICGVGRWDKPIELVGGNKSFPARDAISYTHENNNVDDGHGEISEDADGTLWVKCKVGCVKVK